MAIAGVDIGTTGCKCSVYSKDGEFLAEAYSEYKANISEESHTLSPLLVWASIKSVIKKTSDQAGDLEAIAITSFGEAAILLDSSEQPLMDSLLYTDPRGKDECNNLIEYLGKNTLNKITGLNPDAMYTISKLIWIKKHKPEVYEKCKSICLFQDYIVFMLSGVRQIDYSLATRTMAFNINSLCWDDSILNFAGIEAKLLSKVVPIGSKAGLIKEPLAEELGISKKTVIVTGCHDQIAAAIGTGVFKEGMAVDGTGTVECITNVFNSTDMHINKELLYNGSYAIVPFMNQLSVSYAFSFTGGALLKWYRDKLAYFEAKRAKEKGENEYNYFDDKLDTTKPSGLLALPYFAGAGTPHMNRDAKGAIIGLTLNTTSSDIYKALMEGVTYEMRLNIERLKEAGIEINTIRATGGGATSKKWLQIKADILNKPIVSLGAAQSGTIGCVMLAGVACGVFTSMEDAEKIFVKQGKTYFPDKVMVKKYDEYYKKYKKLYSLVKNVM